VRRYIYIYTRQVHTVSEHLNSTLVYLSMDDKIVLQTSV